MESIKKLINSGNKNFVFVGEAGSGKSEISINFAQFLNQMSDKQVHFFDLDMTKPLFRSRDICEKIGTDGIVVHFQEQFMDAPTLVGGVRKLLKDENAYVIMDVGGDHIGARAIGGFAKEINKDNTVVYYVLNAFRPWSYDIDHIDKTLISILGASHVQLEKLRLINNPNVGFDTTPEEFVQGCEIMENIVNPYMPIDLACVRESVYNSVRDEVKVEVMPLHLYLTYPWLQSQ